MRRRRSRFADVASVCACLAALCAPEQALAQACCGGAGALTPGRLNAHEDALAGVQIKAMNVVGSFEPDRSFAGASEGAHEIDFEEDLIGTARVLSHGQLTLLVPVVETWRRTPRASEAGGGLGDLQLGARFDFVAPGQSPWIPGVALLGTVTLPTGVAPESAPTPLATGATGAGAAAGAFGLALEQTFGDVLVQASFAVTMYAPREVSGLRTRRGPQLVTFAAGGYTFRSGAVLALTGSYMAETDALIAGQKAPDSGRALLRLGVSGGLPLGDEWRIQGGVFGDPPLDGLSRNQPAGVGLTTMLMRVW